MATKKYFKTDGLTTSANSNLVVGGSLTLIGEDALLGGNAAIIQPRDDLTLLTLASGANSSISSLWIEDLANSITSNLAAIYINSPGGALAGSIRLASGNNATTVNLWDFKSDGTVVFPTLTVDIHNGGNQTAQTLQFGDNTQQAIITGPTPSANINAQRLIIQGQAGNGTGEGGDVYLWGGDADTNGGDIKIYAGDADNVSAGSGGYVNIEGGSGFDFGGYVSMQGGQCSNGQGAPASVIGGYGQSGGFANIVGGQGYAGPGGVVNITGGASGNGLAEYGNVNIGAGASIWTFDNTGTLTVPGNIITSGSGGDLTLTGGNISGANVVNSNTVVANNINATTAFKLPVYADNTARDTAIVTPATGMMVFVTGSGMQVYGATQWNAVSGTST